MEPVQNVTLSLPRRLLKRAKVIAIERDKSLSRLMVELLEDLVRRDDEYERARAGAIAMLRNPPSLGTGGRRSWTREELHER
ncbi:MAG: CopG family transcriptional regulator [Actinomycetota bacterium]